MQLIVGSTYTHKGPYISLKKAILTFDELLIHMTSHFTGHLTQPGTLYSQTQMNNDRLVKVTWQKGHLKKAGKTIDSYYSVLLICTLSI